MGSRHYAVAVGASAFSTQPTAQHPPQRVKQCKGEPTDVSAVLARDRAHEGEFVGGKAPQSPNRRCGATPSQSQTTASSCANKGLCCICSVRGMCCARTGARGLPRNAVEGDCAVFEAVVRTSAQAAAWRPAKESSR